MSGVRYQDRSVTRRQVLRTLAGGLATCALPAQEAKSRDALLEEIERRACLYFYEQGHPATGLVLDRIRVDGVDDRRVASISATGFGLSALCIEHQDGFLPYRWDEYSELLAMYLLAIGSTTNPIPVSGWDSWTRPNRIAETGDMYVESRAPLFVHQYSHAWFDFRNQQDGWANYFQNS